MLQKADQTASKLIVNELFEGLERAVQMVGEREQPAWWEMGGG